MDRQAVGGERWTSQIVFLTSKCDGFILAVNFIEKINSINRMHAKLELCTLWQRDHRSRHNCIDSSVVYVSLWHHKCISLLDLGDWRLPIIISMGVTNRFHHTYDISYMAIYILLGKNGKHGRHKATEVLCGCLIATIQPAEYNAQSVWNI